MSVMRFILAALLALAPSLAVADCLPNSSLSVNHAYIGSSSGCMTDGGVLATIAGGDLGGNPLVVNSIQGQTVTGTTGTGTVVLSASPTISNLTDIGASVLTGLTVTPTAAATVSTDQSQASGGSTLLPFASTSGISVGQVVKGTSIPLGDQVSSIVSTAQATRAANGSFSSGQKVIPMSVTTAFAVGQQCADTTNPTSIGAGNVIASIQAATSITLTSNVAVSSSGAADSITCDPVVTLTKTTTATVSAGASINFYATQTVVSASSSVFTNAGISAAGNLNVGGTSFLGQAISGSASAPGVALFNSNQGFFQSGGSFGFSTGGTTAFSLAGSTFVVGNSLNNRTVSNGGATPPFQVQGNGGGTGAMVDFSYRASATFPAALYLAQSNNNNFGSQTAVASGTQLGGVYIEGSDGTNFQDSALIRGEVDGGVSAGIVPGRIKFLTANSAGTLTNAVTIDSSQNVNVPILTASLPVCTDASKNLTSTCPAGDLPILIGTTSAIGGGALTPGACAAGTATVTGARSTMVATASPSADPDSTLSTGIAIYAFVSANDTVTVRVCAIVAVTPTSTTYNVRVIQ